MRSAERAGRRRPRGPTGFTLIEVVVAVTILAMALVAWLSAHAAELRALSIAREVNVAVELAEDRMASLEMLGRDRLPSLPDSLEDGRFPPPFEHMTWRAAAEELPATDLIELRVVVRWESGEHALAKVVHRRRPRAANR